MLDFIRSLFNLNHKSEENETPGFSNKTSNVIDLRDLRDLCDLCDLEELLSPSTVYCPYTEAIRNPEHLTSFEIEDFFESLCKKSKRSVDFVLPGYFPDGLLNPDPFLRGKKLTSRLKSAEVLFCPIVIDYYHWYLIIIEKKEENIFSIKTLDGFNQFKRHDNFYEQASLLLEIIHGKGLTLVDKTRPSYHIRPQNNAIDCGVVVCHYATKFLQGEKIEESSMKEFNYYPLRDTYFPSRGKPEIEYIVIESESEDEKPTNNEQLLEQDSRRPVLVQ